jgi:4-amino-4-deoxy-L-arabinose transferase-like glycosyltransferase
MAITAILFLAFAGGILIEFTGWPYWARAAVTLFICLMLALAGVGFGVAHASCFT